MAKSGAILLISMAALISGCASHVALNPEDWQTYKARFLRQDGRVMDSGKKGFSHSEGQGYAMLLAVAFQDREAFDRIATWTEKRLGKARKDGLHAWKWNPYLNRVTDANNATDADLVIAWAYLRAATQWKDERYEKRARRILNGLTRLQHFVGKHVFLRPGAAGFTRGKGLMLNPSYLIFPAYFRFEQATGDSAWTRLYRDGIWLIGQCQFGEWALPADWVDIVPGKVSLARTRQPFFGYDALRIPLYLAWAGEAGLLTPYERFWDEFTMRQFVPDRVHLQTNDIHLTRDFQAIKAIRALVMHVLKKEARFPTLRWNPKTGYYDASLTLLAQMAWTEISGGDSQ